MPTLAESRPSDSFNFVQAEHQVLQFWREERIFERSLEQTRDKAPYIFYDGPPFATGLPHHGHVVAGTLKDIVPRYWTMKGRYIQRRFGWDCHGLPIEHEIDKKLGLSAHEAAKKMGVAAYNAECRSIVHRYVAEWRKTTERLGRWVDFDNDYKTMDTPFMESVWWVFKQLWDKKLIYRGTRVVPFSTALGTVLSNFEAGLNYRQVQDPAITVLFKLRDEEAYMAAWTTTPWTLPSNLGLCVGGGIDYVLIRDGERNIYLAETALERYAGKNAKGNPTILKRCRGSDLTGRRYHPLFPYFAECEAAGAFCVFADNYVSTETGTGIVHLAPAFGEDDHRIFKRAQLDMDYPCPIDTAGKFTAETDGLQGLFVKDADKNIIQQLKEGGQLYRRDSILHNYPYCYRSDTPLIYRMIPSWYLSVESIKEQLLRNNAQINWVPEHIKDGRFGNWLAEAKDWSISRNRVWGTPLPVWHNQETGEYMCIGSIAELKTYTGVEVDDLHRETVDGLEFQIDGKEGTFKRISEVLDCWFESGSMPYAQLHYPFENRSLFERGFPAEFIAEGLDQTRGWFYTLTVLATALFDKPAFKNVVVNGIVMAKDGKKMSKRLQNYTPPMQLMEAHGADAVRLYLINSGLVRAEEMHFSDEGVKDLVRRALLPWYNAFKFFSTYARLDDWKWDQSDPDSPNITDNWIISRLQTLKQNISREMEGYRLYTVVPALLDFIEELTNWYIRLNRTRFWAEGEDASKRAAYNTLYTCLKEASTAMAPFAPFLSEHLYRQLLGFHPRAGEIPVSVHLCPYPQANSAYANPLLERAMDRMQQVILLGRQKRTQKKIKVKTPLASLTCIHRERELLNELKKLETYLKSELNVKKIEYSTEEENYIDLYARPNLPVLGKRLGKNLKQFLPLIKNLGSEELREFEQSGKIELNGEHFGQGDLLVFREARPKANADNIEVISNRYISIALDCHLTPQLKREGLAREVVAHIQRARKEENLRVEDRIRVCYACAGDLQVAIEAHRDTIARETLSVELAQGKEAEGTHPHQCQIDGEKLGFTVEKVS